MTDAALHFAARAAHASLLDSTVWLAREREREMTVVLV